MVEKYTWSIFDENEDDCKLNEGSIIKKLCTFLKKSLIKYV